ncbi:4Fe-4S dicluster domain-containing protein [Candidatus Thorarchaeota archaeon]|nr:MAG: 4Fe-4S dicluster domain-containing protein [Candidatus Thorarchaeota archaeon]
MSFYRAREDLREWLEQSKRRKAFKKLEKEIVSSGVCTECGACVEICPVDAITGIRSDEKYTPTLTGECIACGLCYAICPRTLLFREDLLGNYIEAWKAQSLSEREGQNGGVVSSLLRHLLKVGDVDRAICGTSQQDKPWKPRAVSIRNPEDVPTGTIYSHAPVIGEVLCELKKGTTKLAVTGTSCAIDSLVSFDHSPANLEYSDITVLRLGLFCMESFTYNGMKKFLEDAGIEIDTVEKMEISKGKFRAYLGHDIREWPVADLDSTTASSCQYCTDLTCINADISFGNIGSDDLLTTVLVRTPRGKRLFDAAIEDSVIKAEVLTDKELLSIERIAMLKATRCYTQ